MTAYWWTCHHEKCLDRMAESEWAETVIRDRDAHIAEHHPGWQPTEAEKHISSWPTLTTTNT